MKKKLFKLVIGFGGILTLPRSLARAQGFSGERFKEAPFDRYAHIALRAFCQKYGSDALALVLRCRSDQEEREVKEWLEEHRWRLEDIGLTEVHIVRVSGERAKKVTLIGATCVLDDCGKFLEEVALPPEQKLFFGTDGMHDGDDIDEPYYYCRDWIYFMGYFELPWV